MDDKLHQEVLELTQALVKIPSRTEKESELVIAEFIKHKLEEFGFNPEMVGPQTQPSIMCYIEKDPNAKTIWLEAPLDTSRSSDVGAWKFPPFEAVIDDGKMYGCGVSACKIAVAMYSVLARELANDPSFNANIFLAFNADEQCGSLTGAREIIHRAPKADLCLLGYQGNDEISIGARGWLRLHVQTIGRSIHTGERSAKGVNAIHSMSRIINAISSLRLKFKKDTFFWFGPSIHVTTVKGGVAMNIVPDYCRINIDIRLVPGQDDKTIVKQVEHELEKMKKRDKDFEYVLDVFQYQSAYLTDPTHPFINIMQTNIKSEYGKRLPLVASGHGSAGNLINELGVPIINAFGVEGGNEHAPNEWISTQSVRQTFDILSKSLIEFTKS